MTDGQPRTAAAAPPGPAAAPGSGDASTASEDAAPALPVLTEPAEGVPEVVADPAALADAAERLAAGTGPLAVDAERASGYRYGQRAFLVQLRRAGTGTLLVDPDALPDLSVLADAAGDAEWVLHAAGQDLPCLADVGMRPGGDLVDTELGARLAGFPRVGLAAVLQRLLGVDLAKEHSAVDWSTRPLPEPWLRYAALDVELLLPLRDALLAVLDEQGKLDWARQEFAAVRDAPPAPPRTDPWRRTSGLHAVRSRRQLAVVRELWEERERIAQRRDVSPGRVLPDRAVVAAATAMPTSPAALAALPVFSGPANRRRAATWLEAVRRGQALPERDLPPTSTPSIGPPPPRSWKDKDPAAAARLAAARDVVAARSEELDVPVENLLQPDLLRRTCWEPPSPLDEAGLRRALAAGGARPWQVDLLAPDLAAAMRPETGRTGAGSGAAQP
ncbi:HRDC domain-containing protein [uncultured Pseudokineococcus sp.]|uniref:HRDC domain-containing protein n=1 Tax=uncultured Pseudokineococcus sp. TaxID=1642928 RepID=UPI0026168F75|nr:HRDC domain-containing protein [uncultured Pseudokineococcus sp.]